jgi:hypothetical protein
MNSAHPPLDGACKGKPSGWWYPNLSNHSTPRQRSETREQIKLAVGICKLCDKRIECLNYAIEWEPFGIWGGETEGARERMRRNLGLRILRPTLHEIVGYPERGNSYE